MPRSSLTLVWLLCLGIGLSLLPIIVPRLLPLLDQPNHLAAIAVWHRLASLQTSWGYQHAYSLHIAPVPYCAYYLPVHLLAYLLPIEAANKVVLCLYAVALPLSMLALALRWRRSPWLVLLSLPLIFNYNIAYGFLPFALGIPALIGSLAALDWALEQPRPGRLLLCGALTFLTFFFHVLLWIFGGLCAGVVLLLALFDSRDAPRPAIGQRVLHRGASRRFAISAVLRCAAALLPSVAFAAWSLRHGAAEDVAVARDLHAALKFEAIYPPLRHQLMTVPERLVLTGPGPAVPLLLGILLLTLLVLHLTTRYRQPPLAALAAPRIRGPRRFAAEALMLLSIAAYLVVPFTLRKPFHWWNVGPRFLCLAAMFGLLSVRGPLLGRQRLLLLPALLAIAAYPLWLTERFLAFNGRAAGALRLLARAPRGSEVLVVPLGDHSDPAVTAQVVPYTEFQSYAQLLVGGFNHVGWKLNFPYRVRWKDAPPTPHWAYPEQFRQAEHGARHDYVLTHREASDFALFQDNPEWRRRVPLLGRDGEWRLYRTRGIR